MLYFPTSQLSTNHPTIPTNTYSSQCLPQLTHDPDLQPPPKHLILTLLSLLPLLPYLIQQNLILTTSTLTSKRLTKNIILIWKPWMTRSLKGISTSLIFLQNWLIQFPKQTSKNKNSQIFHLKYQLMKNTCIKWS